MKYYIYILASKKNGVLYTGVTNNLQRRIYEHSNELAEGFTKKYKIKKLVYFESCSNAEEAILREKRIKYWKRECRIDLIEKSNPEWKDLYKEIF